MSAGVWEVLLSHCICFLHLLISDIRNACDHLENVLIQQATQSLVNEAEVAILQLKISPYTLKVIDTTIRISLLTAIQIPSVVHSMGINLRYIGFLCRYIILYEGILTL
jgi:hypothetical protein